MAELAPSPSHAGRLILVVGPSGVGKDSILRSVAGRLDADPRFVFARRQINRRSDPGREDYDSVSTDEFLARRAAGHYALWWRSYETFYGVPSSINVHLLAGRQVLVNVSREIIVDARPRYHRLAVLWVHARIEVIEQRLRARPDETESDPQKREESLQKRLARAREYSVEPPYEQVDNNGALEQGVANFLAALGR